MTPPRALAGLIAAGLLAAPATAQLPVPPPAAPAAPPRVTFDALATAVRGAYPKELSGIAQPDPKAVKLVLSHTLAGTKQAVEWTVWFGVIRGGDAARVWFNCQALPADADPGRLRALLDWSGGHDASGAYFKTARSGADTMLSLVLDLPAADATPDRLRPHVLALFRMADDTRHVWAGKLSDPLPKPAAKPAAPPVTVQALAGAWNGKQFRDGKEVGQFSVTFGGPGGDTALLLSRVDTSAANPVMQILTGAFDVTDGVVELKLILAPTGVIKRERYAAELAGKTLTLTPVKGEAGNVLKLSRD